jgi:hypothetical protein
MLSGSVDCVSSWLIMSRKAVEVVAVAVAVAKHHLPPVPEGDAVLAAVVHASEQIEPGAAESVAAEQFVEEQESMPPRPS